MQQPEDIKDPQGQSIEDELKAIFKEEADEQYLFIFQQYDQWKENRGNNDSLQEMRRAFHTLKGSGRMVGAMVIGDFFWAFENLFNKLIEEKISLNASFAALIETFITYLQANKEGLLHAEVQDEAIQRLISDAEKLSNNESIEYFKSFEQVEEVVELESNNAVDENPVVALPVIGEVTKKTEVLDPLLALYLEEFAELLEAFDLTTQALVDDPTDAEAIAGAERQLHTIKGGARMTGLVAIGDLSHAGESLLSKVAQHKVDTDNPLLFKLQEVNDELYRMHEKASSEITIEPATQLIEELQQLSGERSLAIDPQQQDKNIVVAHVESNKHISEEEENVLDASLDMPLNISLPDNDLDVQHTSDLEKILVACADELSTSAETLLPAITQKQVEVGKHQVDTSSIKVSTKIINNLISTTHEWGDQNTRLVEQYEDNSNQIDELKRTTIRLKKQIRTLELETDSLIKSGNKIPDLSRVKSSFDPLEMDEYSELQQQSRALAESLNDLESLTETLEGGLKTMEKTIDEQRTSFKVLQDGLIRTRMMKITSLSSRLKRIVRQTATELGKKVELEIADEQCELDRTILERITASLEHLIRNSLAHGIEHPEQRLKNNKNEVGKIFLEFSREGPEVVITLQDDGQGIDIDKLKQMAISKGLINETTRLSDQEAYQLILKSGVSTANAISQISGRGVGMDVVNAEVNTLGGNIVIDSERGKFTQFTLRVPYNLATNQVMLLGVCDEIIALPIAKLEGMQRLSATELAKRYAMQAPSVNIGGRQYVLKHLGETLGLGTFDVHENEQDITYPLILLEENEQRIAYHVNEIKGNREVMLKPLGPLFDESQLLSSATIMSGRIVLLLNAHELIRMGVTGEAIHGNRVKADLAQSKTKVLVVDDSITVRKITESLLTKLNYTVMTATDGLNALEVLEVSIPDIILLDIEMPRMDGFELLGRLKGSKELKHLPVIMISSRSGAKHKKHAKELGAMSFIGKPWEAKQLSNTIKSCLNNLLAEAI